MKPSVYSSGIITGALWDSVTLRPRPPPDPKRDWSFSPSAVDYKAIQPPPASTFYRPSCETPRYIPEPGTRFGRTDDGGGRGRTVARKRSIFPRMFVSRRLPPPIYIRRVFVARSAC